MSYVEIEVKAKTVDLAVEAAMQELGVDDREQLSVTVVQEPEKGFLGMGGTDAIVSIKVVPQRKRRRDRGGKTRNGSQGNGSQKNSNANRGGNQGHGRGKKSPAQNNRGREMNRQDKDREDDRDVLTIEDQSRIVKDFLVGLVDAYGLEGEVVTSLDDDVIIADINGEQTEALIGVRGSVRSAIHELSRTVLQRYAQDTARLRLDIAGYAERRREALTIYANQLIAQLESEGGELMLEPMSSADRKVIHDAASGSSRVSSFSEGEPPRRYVVLAAAIDGEEE